MLILAFLLFLGKVTGALLPSSDCVTTNLVTRQVVQPDPSCSCQDGDQRSLHDILWSCLATIFACTWVVIHPNIPNPTNSWWEVLRGRIKMTFFALIAPEVVIAWAMRQWGYVWYLEAPKVPKNHPGWTETHGFFVQMGGFVLVDHDDQIIRVLTMQNIVDMSEAGTIDFPRISEKEINDRSKGDLLSKGIASVQTTWFVVQCIARGIQGLVITELELITLGFAALNVITYILWWNKPVDVQCPVHIPLKTADVPSVADDEGHPGGGLSDANHAAFLNNTRAPTVYNAVPTTGGEEEQPHEKEVCFWETCVVRPFMVIAGPLLAMMDEHDIEKDSAFVPMYYAGALEEHPDSIIAVISCFIGILFGGIHCIAWSFQFPTNLEQLLWRIASVTTTAVPFALALGIGVATIDGTVEEASRWKWVVEVIGTIIVVAVAFIGPWVYLIARLDLLFQAFVALRALPPLAYQDVQWTAYIPHI